MPKFQYSSRWLSVPFDLCKNGITSFHDNQNLSIFPAKPYTMYAGISKNYSMSNYHGTPLSLTCKLLAFAANAFMCFCCDH